MNYSRARLRAFFASLTPDSRPCRIGSCPLVVAYRLRNCAEATRVDPELVHAIDRAYKAKYGIDALPWEKFTAADVVEVIDSMAGTDAPSPAAAGEVAQ